MIRIRLGRLDGLPQDSDEVVDLPAIEDQGRRHVVDYVLGDLRLRAKTSAPESSLAAEET